MFARCVTMRLKPNMTAQYKQTLETVIMPLLKRQRGFQDELLLIAPDGSEAIGINLWDSQEHAEMYSQHSYPEVQQILSTMAQSPLQVKTYEVSIATFREKAAASGRTSG